MTIVALPIIRKLAFNGTDTINYTLDDNFGGVAQGIVTVSVQAFETIVITNKSSGGSFGNSWLILLVLIVLVRRAYQIKQIKIMALMIIFMTPTSLQATSWFAEVTIGSSHTKVNVSNIPSDINTIAIDDSDSSFSLGLGYQLTKRFSLKASYLNLGEGSVHFEGDTLNPRELQQSLLGLAPLLADGLAIGASFDIWEYSHFTASIDAGIFSWDSEVNTSTTEQSLQIIDNGVDVYWGAELSAKLNPSWSVFTSYQHHQLNETINSFNIGLRLRFNIKPLLRLSHCHFIFLIY